MKSQTVVEAYSNDHWGKWPDVLSDLVAKFRDRSHVISQKEKINNIFRAVLAFDYIKENFPEGGDILDMGCGIGYNACFLAREGHNVTAFDASDIGIQRAKALAHENGLNENMFICGDHTYLEKIPAESVDVALAMGFIYYLNERDRDYCYKQVHRILRKKGKFLVSYKNHLFDIFSLNNTSLEFWAQMIDDFSPAAKLLKSKGALEALDEKVKVPVRVWEKNSISARFKTDRGNPLTYADTVKRYGYELEDILYPDSHLLPPALEAEVDSQKLLELKAQYCVQQARDWRGIFMCYEFLAFMHKIENS